MDFFSEVIAPSLKDGADLDVLKNSFSEYVTKQNEEFTNGLRENRDKILDEKKKVSQDFDTYKAQYGFLEGKDFTADVYNQMVSDLDSYKSSANNDAEEVRKQLVEQYNAGKKAYEESITPTLNSLKLKLEETETDRDKFQSQYKNYLKDSVIRSTLNEMHVEADDFWMEGLKNSAKVEYDDSGNIKDIFVRHGEGHIPIQDWKKVFPTTDRGKKMIKAPVNVGGAGHGSKGSGGEVNSLDDISAIKDPAQRRAALEKFMDR